jgi:hypothetical protein
VIDDEEEVDRGYDEGIHADAVEMIMAIIIIIIIMKQKDDDMRLLKFADEDVVLSFNPGVAKIVTVPSAATKLPPVPAD